jgi:hypothetical protein
VGHVTRTREIRNVYTILVGKFEMTRRYMFLLRKQETSRTSYWKVNKSEPDLN